MQNRTDGIPGYGYIGDLSNSSMPSGAGYIDRIQDQTGNINNQTSQIQGLVPGSVGGGEDANGDKKRKPRRH